VAGCGRVSLISSRVQPLLSYGVENRISNNPEAELLLLRHELRVLERETSRLNAAMILRTGQAGDAPGVASQVSAWEVGSLRLSAKRGSAAARGAPSTADLEYGARESGLGLHADQPSTRGLRNSCPPPCRDVARLHVAMWPASMSRCGTPVSD
jgi:hypothetical protein